MNISLPESMKRYVDDQVNTGSYGSASEYMRELVRADQKRQEKERVEKLLMQAINSGEPMEVTPEMIEDVRTRLRSRAKNRTSR